MNKYFTQLLLIATLLTACGPAALPSPPTATITQTIIPSETPSPTPQTHEHLLITRDNAYLTMFNADGSLYKSIQMPNDTYIEGEIDDSVSPDGNWLVYEPGSTNPPYNLSLNLLNLEDETFLVIANLISPDFPNNIGSIVETMSQYDESLYGSDCKNLECRRALVQDELLSSVGAYDWSPDGKFLAFAAQIEGPSTDIYIYSIQDKTIRRLTDDLQNVNMINWSPDGKWLLYANNIPGINISGETFYVTDMEGNIFQLPLETQSNDLQWYTGYGWVSDNTYLFQALYYEHPQFRQLIILNAENQQLTEIWHYTTKDIMVDTNNQTIILSFESDPNPNAPGPGTYRISTNGDYRKISDQVFFQLTASSEIIGTSYEDQAFHIKSDDSLKLIGPSHYGMASASPDKKWFFMYEGRPDDGDKFTLYNEEYQRVNSWRIDDSGYNITWRPDSLGVYLFTIYNIYYIDIPKGEPHALLDDCAPDPCEFTWFAWLP